MPELPEVETIRRALEAVIIGEEITGFEVLHPRIIEPVSAEVFAQNIVGLHFAGIDRRGKYLLCRLEGSDVQPERSGTLCIHLRMTGQLHWLTEEQELVPHTHLRLHLASGAELRYVDVRRFGTWRFFKALSDDAAIAALGPEPLSELFTVEYLQNRVAGRAMPIKSFLLRQDIVAGLGNIYCDEALFLSGIRPDRPAKTLNEQEVAALHAAIRAVLQESIDHNGSSLRDYCNIDGQRGQYQEMWRVYQQTDKPCGRCSTPIERMKLSGRSSHYCPQCQV